MSLRVSKKDQSQRDPLTYRIIGCAMAVHRFLGPGLLESVYEECLNGELTRSGLHIARQPALSVEYDGRIINRIFRPDFVVNREVVVEVKSVVALQPVHQAQLLTYMKLAGIERGLIINFNCEYLIRGVRRFILTRQRA